jgi:N6-adenosine-specific RNA methylase IME4
VCFIGTKGSPMRLAKNVHQVVMTPGGEHSEKPEEVRRRLERLIPGPYLELYARKQVPGWKVWGNEIAAPPDDGLSIPPDNSIPACLRREAS